MPRTKLGRNDGRNEKFKYNLGLRLYEKQMTQKRLAAILGVHENTITGWKNKPESISVETLRTIAAKGLLTREDLVELVFDD